MHLSWLHHATLHTHSAFLRTLINPFHFKLDTTPLSATPRMYGVSTHAHTEDTQVYVSCELYDVDYALARLEAYIINTSVIRGAETILNWIFNNNAAENLLCLMETFMSTEKQYLNQIGVSCLQIELSKPNGGIMPTNRAVKENTLLSQCKIKPWTMFKFCEKADTSNILPVLNS